MKYFGIRKPDGIIWWIEEDEHRAWMSFFTYPSNVGEIMPHRLPIAEAIAAYQAVGYKCVELQVSEKLLARE